MRLRQPDGDGGRGTVLRWRISRLVEIFFYTKRHSFTSLLSSSFYFYFISFISFTSFFDCISIFILDFVLQSDVHFGASLRHNCF